MTNSSIFTRVLALTLCLIMLTATLAGCVDMDGLNSMFDIEGINIGSIASTKPNNKDDKDPADPNEIFSASTKLSDDALIYGTLANDVVIGGEGVGALIPADVKVADGASSLALSVKNATTDVDFGDVESVHSLDVHVEGVASDNTVPMIVNLGAVLATGLGNTELKLYHIENGTPVLMTRVENVTDFAIHNQYVYNAETGEVTIYVASFSVFTAIKTSADVWDGEAVAEGFDSGDGTEENPYIINTAAQLVYFRNQVDAGVTYAGQFVKLNKDIDLAGHLFDPIGKGYVHNGGQAFMGTFDGQGHTIYNLYQNGWDLGYSYSTVGGGLFASIKDATIKNLVVSGANIVMECIDMGTVVGYAQGKCHFENIVVTNSKLANYQRYTGGVVGEVCKADDVEGEYTHTFINVTVDSSVKVSSLWGDFDNACGGVIGGKWGTARVLMQNVNVAAEIDAFSDVTAAYQWYAYRRCGMLIGHTEQNSPKSALNADAPFLTCIDVNVYYGDWVDYTYYQFANQTDEAGNRLWNSNYPWVRAEAGEHNGVLSNVRYGNPIINGVAINTVEAAELNKTEKVTITFNQLYGGGQGVYGKADHPGVTIHDDLTKTVYIENDLGWTDLYLYYWFENGADRWSTVVDGIQMTEVANGIYKVEVPAYADGFKVVGTRPNVTTFTTPEILLSAVEGKSTYPLTAFNLTLTIGESKFDVVTGNWLYNTQVNNNTVPKAEDYDVIIYDKNYTGTFTTNDYGVALVINAQGQLVKGYAWDGYYTAEGKVAIHYATADYATTAFNELVTGETLIIFPNDGTNADDSPRTFAKNICNNWETTMGQPLTLTTTVNEDVHVCSNVCTTCFGCRNKECTHADCTGNRCDCLDISIKVDIEGFENTFVVTENNWLYNTQIDRNHYPYAAHYQVVVYDKTYTGETFTTNEYGIAVVLDADNNIVKIYDAANGDKSVVYYDLDGVKTLAIDNANYATRAWSELKDGEKLVIFPNHKSDNSARNWAKKLCENWELVKGAKATLTATFKLPTTIYFQNNQNWTNVGVQYWFEDGTTTTGVIAATGNDGRYDIYRVVLPANVVKVAFGSADGSDDKATVTVVTPEITSFQNGYIYVVNGTTVKSCEYKSGYNTVYFYNNKSWTNVYLYYWFEDAQGKAWDTLGFPGEKMTASIKDGTYSIYEFVVPAYAVDFIIGNGIQPGVSGHQQTENIVNAGSNGKIYYIGEATTTGGTTYNAESSTYSTGSKTIYFLNNWNWATPQYSYMGIYRNMTYVKQEGTYKTYSITIPNFVAEFKVNLQLGEESEPIESITNGATYCMYYTNNKKQFVECVKLYLKPNDNWKKDSAWFAARIWNNDGDAWFKMNKDGDYYYCYVPQGYVNVIFCRMNSSASSTSTSSYVWGNVWNQTSDLTFSATQNCYTIASGAWSKGSGTWTQK